ncbi:hypothetical protein B0H17DRAFT_1208281 [Mycena rosella]|uniref:Uncharacterized protein n=1 Tax=Mycena rosella TaxID=1033263 RepID=A0AAD7D1J7_MYCRO|nr:hypothetical protein B0H17DRAFT_1208281 [Mycena rosella]
MSLPCRAFVSPHEDAAPLASLDPRSQATKASEQVSFHPHTRCYTAHAFMAFNASASSTNPSTFPISPILSRQRSSTFKPLVSPATSAYDSPDHRGLHDGPDNHCEHQFHRHNGDDNHAVLLRILSLECPERERYHVSRNPVRLSPPRTPRTAAPRRFLHKKAAMAGMFAISALAGAIPLVCVVTRFIRRRRACRNDRMMTDAAYVPTSLRALIDEDDAALHSLDLSCASHAYARARSPPQQAHGYAYDHDYAPTDYATDPAHEHACAGYAASTRTRAPWALQRTARVPQPRHARAVAVTVRARAYSEALRARVAVRVFAGDSGAGAVAAAGLSVERYEWGGAAAESA